MNRNLQLIAVAAAAAGIGAAAVWFFQHDPSTPVAPPLVAAAPGPDPTAPPPAHAPLPHMQIQAQYGGPLQDTLIQRLRDPIDGTICYLYLPIAVHHTLVSKDTGYVDYGGNAVGAISCYAPLVQVRVAPPLARPPPPVTAPP